MKSSSGAHWSSTYGGVGGDDVPANNVGRRRD